MAGEAARFATEVWENAAAAQAAGGVENRWFEVAGRLLLVRFAGSALQPLIVPALSHLETEARAERPDLTVLAWDCASLGLAYPEAPVPMDAFTPRGEVRDLTGGRFHVAFEPGGRLLSLMDSELRRAAYCVGDAQQIPRFDRAEPIRGILSWFMRAHGRQLVHAGAVGRPEGGALLLGPSGAGKSNTCLGCLGSDLLYAADDFCAVSTEGPPRAFVYSTGKTLQSDWVRHPHLGGLAAHVDPSGRDKVIYFLADSSPEKLVREFPIKAVLVIRLGGEACGAIPISAVAALTACAPDTARLLPDSGAEVLKAIARLVRSAPCFELRLGADPKRIPAVISELLATLGVGEPVSA
jgi:hypothetical protein